MELSKRQAEIVTIIKENSPITAEDIAERFGMSKATLRPDFTLLTHTGIISAKPRVGYFYNEESTISEKISEVLATFEVADLMGEPSIVLTSTSVHDTIIELFTKDVGSLFVCDEQDVLQGVISRKDLLKAAIGQNDLKVIPVSMIMTRMPNIITVTQEDLLLSAAQKMDTHMIDSVPVVEPVEIDGKIQLVVVGRVTKTTIVKAFVKLGVK